ncbi:LON peptidase substrate-binding domain-containing protein [Marivivens donghaensis]|uniref:LON peptidase substrate-binding domain-containing protein n=1 Tax=Marivivens donghaensis TaxID=1699413 RepID=UPI00201F668C|nr:LON peptidase substrate-binding domain-containing protein [Marivivens donghaensis]MCL7409490.1 LON peptidase substrate-binding domain-containing protein [Marivivens donghaensis]MDN3702969.1 LON peptidase substrate-binding domain-containing protein [Marivivens donghaensis]
MRTSSDLPLSIPVFPLPGALLLPRAKLPLHIFEPRYLAMIEDVMKTPERLLGMIQPNGGRGLHRIGCAGRLTAFSETEDGRYMITLTGISRFRLADEVDGFTPYRKFNVSWDGFGRDLGPVEHDPDMDRDVLLSLLERFFDDKGLSTDWDGIRDAEDELLINSLSMLCPFEPEDRQALLEAPELAQRRETLITLISYALHGGGEERLQ